MEAQGLFINLCSMYWSQGCTLSIEKAKRRYNVRNTIVWEELEKEGVIKIKKGMIIINFLDEQLKERKKLSVQNSENVGKRWKNKEKNTTVVRLNNDRINSVYNIEEKRREKKRGELEEKYYQNSQTAFEDISNNYLETEPHKTILSNRGWRTVTDDNCKSLLFHFLESQVDLSIQAKNDVKSHFKRWLNKRPIDELRELSTKIHERLTNQVR